MSCQPAIRLCRCSIASSDSRRRTGGATRSCRQRSRLRHRMARPGKSLRSLRTSKITFSSISVRIQSRNTTPFTCSSDPNYAELGAPAGGSGPIMTTETARDGMRGGFWGRTTRRRSRPPGRTTNEEGRTLRRRLAAAVALAAVMAALLAVPGVASGSQAADQALVRCATALQAQGRRLRRLRQRAAPAWRAVQDLRLPKVAPGSSRSSAGRRAGRLAAGIAATVEPRRQGLHRRRVRAAHLPSRRRCSPTTTRLPAARRAAHPGHPR